MANRDDTLDPAVSTSKLARALGISSREVQRRAEAGQLARVGYGKYALQESIRCYCAKLREEAAGRQSRDGRFDVVTESARLKRSQRDLTDLRIAEMKGELLPL